MPAPAALFDEQKLEQLTTELGEESVVAVLRKLSAHVVESSARIAHLHHSGDLPGLRREAHSLKGAAAMVCAQRLEAIALQIEQDNAVSEDSIARLNACADEMAAYIEKSFG